MNNANQSKASLRCTEAECRRDYPINERLYECQSCGGLLDVAYDFRLQGTPDEIKKRFKERKATETDSTTAECGAFASSPFG